MPLKISDATIASFAEVFEEFRSDAPKNKLNLILFLVDKDPATSLSICPDCSRAEPVIYKKLESASDDIALLRTYVGDIPAWKNPQNPWREDSRFKLTSVPTLIRWEKDTIKGRLEDNEAYIEDKIEALVA
ncbi:thioredoxin-like protein Clot [Neltuma alba]|uniref:thioredoxin-like protein Clot n=1 Tax=Neltuma alba TaxID=207710 RepID=UPI0010A3FFC5|nr:thioredoxin-like protein Clot [Prosopis alba]XP_028799773.1 thioredoxin-like protein Clot [Prosopis alba]